MTHKMLAAVLYSPSKITVEEMEFSNDRRKAVMKVNASAICGYDVKVFRNGHSKVTLPRILGHELCGELLQSVITNNGTIEAGSRVAVSPIIPCLECKHCQYRNYNLCINLKEIGSTIDGGFAEYIMIPEKIIRIGGLVPVPDNLSDEEAALLEPLACCLNGFAQMGPITEEKYVAILGDGPIGLLHLQLSKLYGAKTIVVGKIPARMQKAKALGADAVFDDDPSETVDNILDFTDGTGVDSVIVATSNLSAFALARKIASKNSKINLFAGLQAGGMMLLDPNWIHYNQISIIGSFGSTPLNLQEATRLAANKEVDLSKLITHHYSLDEIEEALSTTENYTGLRAVINEF